MQLFRQRALTRSPRCSVCAGTKSRGHQSPVSREPCRSPWSIRGRKSLLGVKERRRVGETPGVGAGGPGGPGGPPCSLQVRLPRGQYKHAGGRGGPCHQSLGPQVTPTHLVLLRFHVGGPHLAGVPGLAWRSPGPSDTAHFFWSLVFAQPLSLLSRVSRAFVSHGISNVFWLLSSDVTGST